MSAAAGAARPSEITAGAGQASHPGLTSKDIAVVVNTADPLSVAIGRYYATKRQIPPANLVRLNFEYRRDELPPLEFAALKRRVDAQLSRRIQAFALTWARPYRVGCMSITSAFAFGASDKFCASGCRPTAVSPYFNRSDIRPYTDLGLRPAMTIAAVDLEHARDLIDHGVRSDGLSPAGTVYLASTRDSLRNVRTAEYPLAARVAAHEFGFHVVAGDRSDNLPDVIAYFTGAERVAGIETNHFLPGAVADHLTSFGGMLTDSPQMSALRWLEAGATGSYGTVVEPCNLLGKFPEVAVFLAHYLAGETLIESYWKSVLMPGQGIFIGEPLAAPFKRH